MTHSTESLLLFVKKACPTCEMIEPIVAELSASDPPLTVYCQDDPSFPDGAEPVVYDESLEISWRWNIETVPTLIRVEGGQEAKRLLGWHREEWRNLTGLSQLGESLPDFRPGCGALNVEPAKARELDGRFGHSRLSARQIEIPELSDEMEVCFERGWTDGLPVVPPTPERVLAMLKGTRRKPDELLGVIPPNKVPCTVEKAAINAVMAGCKPEYLPVVLTAVEAACLDAFCMHGLLATTYFSAPVVIVNGPIRRAIQMNSGINALGQGNRANATIGRALQLIVRNVGGGEPGGVDRATLGSPGKYTFCFAEDEENSPWESLARQQGYGSETSTVTLFPGHGVLEVFDQLSRTPESLARSMAAVLQTVAHPKICLAADAAVIVSPEHAAVFRQAGWSKQQLIDTLQQLLQRPGKELVRGAAGIAEGLPEAFAETPAIPKFKEGGLIVIHAGGKAGKFSAVLSGWLASGLMGSQIVTREINP